MKFTKKSGRLRRREEENDLVVTRKKSLLRVGHEVLEISDLLPISAVSEAARSPAMWRSFALLAANATSYAHLGKLLVKCYEVILEGYLESDWLTGRCLEWKVECFLAKTGATVRRLTRELMQSVCWKKVNRLWRNDKGLGPEWKDWKDPWTTCWNNMKGKKLQPSVDGNVGRMHVDGAAEEANSGICEGLILKPGSRLNKRCTFQTRDGKRLCKHHEKVERRLRQEGQVQADVDITGNNFTMVAPGKVDEGTPESIRGVSNLAGGQSGAPVVGTGSSLHDVPVMLGNPGKTKSEFLGMVEGGHEGLGIDTWPFEKQVAGTSSWNMKKIARLPPAVNYWRRYNMSQSNGAVRKNDSSSSSASYSDEEPVKKVAARADAWRDKSGGEPGVSAPEDGIIDIRRCTICNRWKSRGSNFCASHQSPDSRAAWMGGNFMKARRRLKVFGNLSGTGGRSLGIEQDAANWRLKEMQDKAEQWTEDNETVVAGRNCPECMEKCLISSNPCSIHGMLGQKPEQGVELNDGTSREGHNEEQNVYKAGKDAICEEQHYVWDILGQRSLALTKAEGQQGQAKVEREMITLDFAKSLLQGFVEKNMVRRPVRNALRLVQRSELLDGMEREAQQDPVLGSTLLRLVTAQLDCMLPLVESTKISRSRKQMGKQQLGQLYGSKEQQLMEVQAHTLASEDKEHEFGDERHQKSMVTSLRVRKQGLRVNHMGVARLPSQLTRKAKPIQCAVCKLHFRSKYHVMVHIRAKHPEVEHPEPFLMSAPPFEPPHCPDVLQAASFDGCVESHLLAQSSELVRLARDEAGQAVGEQGSGHQPIGSSRSIPIACQAAGPEPWGYSDGLTEFVAPTWAVGDEEWQVQLDRGMRLIKPHGCMETEEPGPSSLAEECSEHEHAFPPAVFRSKWRVQNTEEGREPEVDCQDPSPGSATYMECGETLPLSRTNHITKHSLKQKYSLSGHGLESVQLACDRTFMARGSDGKRKNTYETTMEDPMGTEAVYWAKKRQCSGTNDDGSPGGSVSRDLPGQLANCVVEPVRGNSNETEPDGSFSKVAQVSGNKQCDTRWASKLPLQNFCNSNPGMESDRSARCHLQWVTNGSGPGGAMNGVADWLGDETLQSLASSACCMWSFAKLTLGNFSLREECIREFKGATRELAAQLQPICLPECAKDAEQPGANVVSDATRKQVIGCQSTNGLPKFSEPDRANSFPKSGHDSLGQNDAGVCIQLVPSPVSRPSLDLKEVPLTLSEILIDGKPRHLPSASTEQLVGVGPSKAEKDSFQMCLQKQPPTEIPRGTKWVVEADLSRGRERVPIPCVVDADMWDTWKSDASDSGLAFEYIVARQLHPALADASEGFVLACSCTGDSCLPGTCEHVALFQEDNAGACDLEGRPMGRRFPYDSNGRVIVEEQYLLYECSRLCPCNATCPNRVLQGGVRKCLEVFRTSWKGWGVRAAEVILQGTFVCEYIGEIVTDQVANKRGQKYDDVGRSYLYDIDVHLDTSRTRRKLKERTPFVIDATTQGNVARFINHSCAPNLVNYQVLVESMDCQLAHIGLFAMRDIQVGEELSYDYRYKLLPGKGFPCHCRAKSCRGRLY